MGFLSDLSNTIKDFLSVDFLGMDSTIRAVLFGGIFLLTLALTLWLFYREQAEADGSQDLIFRVAAAVGTSMTLPALVIAAFNLEVSRQSIVNPLGHLAVGGAILAGLAAVASLIVARPGDEWEEDAPAVVMPSAVAAPAFDDETTRIVRRPDDATRIERIDTFAEMAYLVEKSGQRAGTIHRLRERTTIGRDASAADTVLDDDRASRSHASIRFQGGEFVLRDLDSANGTWISAGDQRSRVESPHRLIEHDRIQIGDTSLVFIRLATAAHALAPAASPGATGMRGQR